MIAKRGVRILRLLLQLEHDRIQNQPPHTRAEELMSERSSTMASNSNPNQYGVHSRMSENAERLAVDVHRLVVQAFYEQEVASHRRPQKGTGQRQESEFTLSPTLHGPNHWPWPVPAQEDFDFGEEHSTRSPTSVQSSNFLRAYPEGPAAANASSVHSRFSMNDSLEDILFLAQNGGPG
jgi:hypothetical protein